MSKKQLPLNAFVRLTGSEHEWKQAIERMNVAAGPELASAFFPPGWEDMTADELRSVRWANACRVWDQLQEVRIACEQAEVEVQKEGISEERREELKAIIDKGPVHRKNTRKRNGDGATTYYGVGNNEKLYIHSKEDCKPGSLHELFWQRVCPKTGRKYFWQAQMMSFIAVVLLSSSNPDHWDKEPQKVWDIGRRGLDNRGFFEYAERTDD